MRFFLLILVFSLLFISQINTIVSIDLWWNLKTGEYILKNLAVPRYDIFSYTLQNIPWIDHEWFSQVLLYSIFSKFSWVGLNILKALIISLCFFILLLLVYSRTKRIIPSVFFILLSILAFGYRSFVRPEIFSYIFLCLYLYILEKEKKLFLLPLLQVIWVNLHGYFILGPLALFLYTITEFLSGERNRAKILAITFLFVMIACFINPYFYKGAFYPFKTIAGVFTRQRMWMRYVHELQMPVKANFGRFLFFWNLAICSSITFLINLKNVKLRHILIFGLSFLASYMAVRNIPIFIFVAMPLASLNLDTARFLKKKYEKICIIFLLLITSVLIYSFASNRYYIFTNQAGLRRTESRFSSFFMPKGACDFLRRNAIKGPIFNTLDFGPYIGYRFYPEKRVFIDTRTDLYKDEFYLLYRNAQNYPKIWRDIHVEYGFEIALLRHLFGGTERILRYLYENANWKLVYYDEISCIFLSDILENRKFIKRYEIDFTKKKLMPRDFNIHIARFFQKIGEFKFAEEIYTYLIRRNPKLLEAGNNLAGIYIDTGRYKEGIRLIEGLLSYHPREARLYANLGTAYLRMGKKYKGLLYLEKAARIDPYLRKASYMLGVSYLERGEIDKAMRQFIKYTRLDPYDAEAHRILGDIYKKKGLLNKAGLEYNEADALEF